jgi:hypothetical protein
MSSFALEKNDRLISQIEDEFGRAEAEREPARRFKEVVDVLR